MKKFILLTGVLSLMNFLPVYAGHEGGGGDSYVLDFIKIANQRVLPWLKQNSAEMDFYFNETEFIKAVDPKAILSLENVFESCDGSNTGREVEACYNSQTKLIYLSRTRYKIDDTSSAKLGVIAHEIFRKMNIEGDNYEITSKLIDPKQQPYGENIKPLALVCDVNPKYQTKKIGTYKFNDSVGGYPSDGMMEFCKSKGGTSYNLLSVKTIKHFNDYDTRIFKYECLKREAIQLNVCETIKTCRIENRVVGNISSIEHWYQINQCKN